MRSDRVVWANRLMLDRLIVDANDEPAGMVDDLELREVDGGWEWSAVLCGPIALGGRIGDRIGGWWMAIGRRQRPHADPYPLRIPVELLDHLDVREARLTVSARAAGLTGFRDWVQDKIVARIPGSGEGKGKDRGSGDAGS